MTDHTSIHSPLLSSKSFPVSLSLITALGFGIGAGAVSHLPDNDGVPTSITCQAQSHTLEKYELLEIDDSLRTVEQILGKGLEQKRTKDEVEFIWRNLDGSYIHLVFKDDVLAKKELNVLSHGCPIPIEL